MRISFSSMVADSVRGRSTLWYRSISASGTVVARIAGARDSQGEEEVAAAGGRAGRLAAAGAKTLDGANDTGARRTQNFCFYIWNGRDSTAGEGKV